MSSAALKCTTLLSASVVDNVGMNDCTSMGRGMRHLSVVKRVAALSDYQLLHDLLQDVNNVFILSHMSATALQLNASLKNSRYNTQIKFPTPQSRHRIADK